MLYQKTYTREVSLITLQIWEEQQCKLQKELNGLVLPFSLYDVRDGVAVVYYQHDLFARWSGFVQQEVKTYPQFISELMTRYESTLRGLEHVWHSKTGITNTTGLAEFYALAAQGWVGMAIAYVVPDTHGIGEGDKVLGMKLRIRSADFMENTDRVVLGSLNHLFPQLKEYARCVTLEEVLSGSIPNRAVLEERARHYIYYGFHLYTHVGLSAFVKSLGIEIAEEKVPTLANELRGQVAVVGRVSGVVRVLRSKQDIANLQEGEVLVTAMTTPDYVPAMKKAAAIVTDEGGVTSHAAIAARELGKPCIIGTKVATKLFKTGDRVEVDASTGIIKRE